MPTKKAQPRRFVVGEGEGGMRLDRVVAARLGLPRTVVKDLFREGAVRVDGSPGKAAGRARPGQTVEVNLPAPEPADWPEIPVLYVDEAVLVIDKPAGLPVHGAGRGRVGPSVVAILQGRFSLAGGSPERPGVVHRLDAPTSGVMVLARTKGAWEDLVDQFRRREVKKEYLALVEGELEPEEGEIHGRLARDPARPWRMRVQAGGKGAQTEFSVLARGDGRSLLLVRPKTGRTHQIRVHLSAIGHPVVGDGVYGGGGGRLMLHAWRLGFRHPLLGRWMEHVAPPPPWFSDWLEGLGNTGRKGS
ncbi:MAG: Pseudouridine synthase [Acetothermia bacterium 64_32]|nr:MAG: Pseudouridine synthase [Acetothermia bacterium 64_32]MBC7098554.1 RluA family pseudouridine synthase [Candidatus Bipolaricaulota bacterium]HAF70927.1 RluA family pseudouridine synthase [Candidatus Acetothermia bacterium]